MEVILLATGSLLFIAVLSAEYPVAGAAAVLLAFLYDALIIDPQPVTVGSLHIFPADIVFLPLGVIAAVRIASTLSRRSLAVWAPLLILGGLLLFSFARGVMVVGVQPAGVEFRHFFYFIFGAAYFASFTASRLRLTGLVTAAAAVVAALALLALVRWPLELSGAGIAAAWKKNGPLRVLTAHEAMLLGQAFILCCTLWMAGRASGRVIAAALSLATGILLLQHRTVWLAVALVIMLLALNRAWRSRRALVASVTIAGLITVVLLVALQMEGPFGESLGAYGTDPRTLWWRVVGWRELLAQVSDPLAILFGRPFGSGFARQIDDQLVRVSPHNFYVETLLRAGVVGVALLLLTYLVTFRRLLRLRSRSAMPAAIDSLLALLVTQLIFFWTYAPSYEQCIVLGTALSVCARAWPRTADLRSTGRASDASLPRRLAHMPQSSREHDLLPQGPVRAAAAGQGIPARLRSG